MLFGADLFWCVIPSWTWAFPLPQSETACLPPGPSGTLLKSQKRELLWFERVPCSHSSPASSRQPMALIIFTASVQDKILQWCLNSYRNPSGTSFGFFKKTIAPQKCLLTLSLPRISCLSLKHRRLSFFFSTPPRSHSSKPRIMSPQLKAGLAGLPRKSSRQLMSVRSKSWKVMKLKRLQ